MVTFHQYLKQRLEHAYGQLEKGLAGLTETDARRCADPKWRRYRFGTGLDGSIWGIVWHVAAWKHTVADGLDTGIFPDAEGVLPHEPVFASEPGWPGLQAWLESGHKRLVRILEETSPADLERKLTLEGQTLTELDLFTLMFEHDQYHAGQVLLLRQQAGHVLDD